MEGMLITLTEARDHLRSDTTADDADLSLKIRAASELVMEYLKPEGCVEFTDSAGDLITDSAGDAVGVPWRVKAATCIMTGYLYKDRDEDTDKQWEMGYLPKPVTAILYGKRKPTLS